LQDAGEIDAGQPGLALRQLLPDLSIRDGFPVMIKDEARSESSTEAPSGH